MDRRLGNKSRVYGAAASSAAFVEVDRAEGAWHAARKLGVDLAPVPNPRESARRQQLRAELEHELATPLVATV